MTETAEDFIARRSRVDLYSDAEHAIREAVQAVERLPADIRLTDAVVLLDGARNKVADYVDEHHEFVLATPDDGGTYTLTKEQAGFVRMFRIAVGQLSMSLSSELFLLGLEEPRAMNVPVGEMLRAASVIACAVAKNHLHREPSPALWRKTTAVIFERAITDVGATMADDRDVTALLREARQYVSDAGGDEDGEVKTHSAALLAEIDAALGEAA